jgi:hypothetical protein
MPKGTGISGALSLPGIGLLGAARGAFFGIAKARLFGGRRIISETGLFRGRRIIPKTGFFGRRRVTGDDLRNRADSVDGRVKYG